MIDNTKIELEYVFKTSPRVLENLISTPSGLSEWFADDVHVADDVYTFVWDKSEEKARLLYNKKNNPIRWRWLHHEEDNDTKECYFEFSYEIDSLTKDIIFKLTTVSDTEKEELELLWDNGINDLKRVLGA
jgi:hypothetical protein